MCGVELSMHSIFLLEKENAGRPQHASAIKNLEEARQSIIREFLKSCRACKLCVHCHSAVRPIRQESHVKILHGRAPSAHVVKSMIMEKLKSAASFFSSFTV